MELLEFLKKHIDEEEASFHMPGHKGLELFERLGYGDFVRGLAAMDITEIPGADDLRKAAGAILSIEEGYSELYGSRRSFISVNGSSAPIMAAIMSLAGRGRVLIAQSNSHISVSSGAELAGLRVRLIEPGRIATSDGISYSAPGEMEHGECGGLEAPISPSEIERALEEEPDASAVLVTSPNYYGLVSDIASIAETVHEHGKILIVDQAHGAHLKLFGEGLSAEEQGADIVIESTHKTLCSFTQSAVVNVMTERADAELIHEKLLMLESTSPSYILMASLALNLEILKDHGEELISGWKRSLDGFYKDASELKRISLPIADKLHAGELPNGARLDRSKIAADFSGAGLTGEEAEKELIKRGIYPEFSYGNIVMFLSGIGNTDEDYGKLLCALKEIEG